MKKPLHLDQVERYSRQGVLFPIPVLTDAEVRGCRTALEQLEALHGGTLKRLDNAHLFFRWAYRLATHDLIVDAAESILGDEDILVDGTLILCKYPHDPSYVSWHQDSVYSDWHLSPSTSAWIALSPSTAENGCMRVIVGSHARGLQDHEAIRDPHNLLRRGERIGVEVDQTEAIDLELHPGEMSLHHCNIIHGSNPNRTDIKRIGFIVRFVTRRIGRRDRPLVRARGTWDGPGLELVGEPAESDSAEGLAAWREFNRRTQSS
jgi:ectoine hydroxylase-related dioxygenase (phytanoyl-CoA dioxygenase family)